MLITTTVVAASVYFLVRSIKKLAAYQAHFGRVASEAREKAFAAAYRTEHFGFISPLNITPKAKSDNGANKEGCGLATAIETLTKPRTNLVQVC